jgi:hypothetical protein
MLKPNLIKLVIFVVLAGGFLFVAMNAHMDIYPCTKSDYDSEHERCRTPQSATCDLLTIRRSSGGSRYDCPASLSGGGWAVAILVHGILPYIVAAAAGHFIARRKRA